MSCSINQGGLELRSEKRSHAIGKYNINEAASLLAHHLSITIHLFSQLGQNGKLKTANIMSDHAQMQKGLL